MICGNVRTFSSSTRGEKAHGGFFLTGSRLARPGYPQQPAAAPECLPGKTKYTPVNFVQPVAQNTPLCKMSARADKIGGAWFSPRRAARLRCAIACNYERRDNLLYARKCPVLSGFCKRRNILLHLCAPIAPDQDEKAAFSGAAVSCSLQIRLDSPRGSIQVPAYSLNLCPVRSAGVPDGRRMGGT